MLIIIRLHSMRESFFPIPLLPRDPEQFASLGLDGSFKRASTPARKILLGEFPRCDILMANDFVKKITYKK